MKFLHFFFLIAMTLTARAQDYHKTGDVAINERDLVFSQDNQYIASPDQQIITFAREQNSTKEEAISATQTE